MSFECLAHFDKFEDEAYHARARQLSQGRVHFRATSAPNCSLACPKNQAPSKNVRFGLNLMTTTNEVFMYGEQASVPIEIAEPSSTTTSEVTEEK